MKRYMNFTDQIMKSSKQHPKQMQTDRVNVDQLEYHPLSNEHKGKTNMIKEIPTARSGKVGINDFDYDELSAILNHLCSLLLHPLSVGFLGGLLFPHHTLSIHLCKPSILYNYSGV
jgi:hypothetical protein